MTLSGHQRRRQPALPDRWLLPLVTLVLALGVIVMHSLGIGHHGPSHLGPGPSMGAVGAAGTHHATQHQSTDHQATDREATGHLATHHQSSVLEGTLVEGGVAGAVEGVVAGVVERASHGATAVCLAVLPLLVLLRRRGGGAWFARAIATATRPVVAAPGSSSAVRPRPPGSILTELCILRT